MAASQPEIAEVLAFEPHPQIFPVLEKNVSGNDKIRALEQAVGASNGWLGAMKMDHWWIRWRDYEAVAQICVAVLS